ncbi:hypothetical protein SMAC4_00366 [Sordaria macrospora]|uniref:WGS project CABT00000000 data, contig 2.1 n=2 Tax=Sordaria macrospora TaxID=5147 RepID=F7VKX2_SORMK|nr:uncharacterized protein SMAC_00366 [Sordaria macrospora k-hell]KAH7627687.1 hypothetical protein B0T09DRAFT_347590 [Sordaria sp. MPI-SDFR-AT-0083]WPJ59109.1 hypothetical protein SMAC4_00366 [Sordaria macrospora]CCC06149.1 unnamed protein product [Sordaria macrospora k-hell]
MADNSLDRSLDEILAERKPNAGRGSGSRGKGNRDNGGDNRQRRDRNDYPRDGVRKSFRDDAPRNLDSEWVHDKFEENDRRRAPRRRQSPELSSDPRGSKIRVDNIHYELTQEDLEGLFSRIGPLVKLDMKYDRAGRSEGTAFVTYESPQDASRAIREYDGANAAGQPIRLTLMPSGPRRNPFETAINPRPLAERITVPGGRSRSISPSRRDRELDEEAARKGIDRYRPGGSGRGRSRSPLPRREGGREGGRRPGARREGGGRGGRGGRGGEKSQGGERTRNGRPKKTQEELDAEMEDYFGGGGANQENNAAPAAEASNGAAASGPAEDDIDMGIE